MGVLIEFASLLERYVASTMTSLKWSLAMAWVDSSTGLSTAALNSFFTEQIPNWLIDASLIHAILIDSKVTDLDIKTANE